MDDLISRAAATRAAVISVRDYLGNIDSERDIHIEEGLHELPAVDTAPVVRCRDCKYSDVIYDTTSDTMPLKCLNIRYGGVRPEWFCEHGERRDDDALSGR